MNKPETKTYTVDRLYCDICDELVIQDGKDICLLKETGRKLEDEYDFHLHRTCLIEFLRKNLNNDK